MGKNKLVRFAENKTLPNVIQPTRDEAIKGFCLKGKWKKEYFKNIIGWHIYGYAIINFLIGFLDGLGLTMFIPLLSIATNSNTGQKSLGNLEFFTKFIKVIGLNITLPSVLVFMILIFILKGSFFYFRIRMWKGRIFC